MGIASPRAGVRETQSAPADWSGNFADWRRIIAGIINRVLVGGLNNGGSITFTASATTTAVTDQRVHANSDIALIPTTANAASATGHYVSAKSQGSFTVTHANDPSTDRTFAYRVFG